MPKYSYECSQCEEIITVYHGIDETKTNCGVCKSVDVLKRLPSRFVFIREKDCSEEIGTIVKRSIEEFRENLDQEKEELKNELFDPDE